MLKQLRSTEDHKNVIEQGFTLGESDRGDVFVRDGVFRCIGLLVYPSDKHFVVPGSTRNFFAVSGKIRD